MLSALFAFALPLALGLQAAAQSNSSIVVCIAGQCLQGFSNTTLGTRLTVPGSPSDLLLLPGSYAQSTNPQLLHKQLTASNAKLEPSPGFENATTVAFPLNIGLEPGVVAYVDSVYSGGAAFTGLANSSTGNASAPIALNAASLAISPGVWVAVAAGSSNKRVVLWDSLPDVAQLPTSASGALALLDIQGTSCSPACAGAGVCTAAGTCACPSGFNGTACEACSPGFFGPQCQACPSNCSKCDDGISGSGLCLVPEVQNAPSTCNCLNGKCEADGSCTCNAGWTKSDNGTECAKCSSGFFLSSSGNCQVCQLGCDQCSDGTGECVQCKSGFTQNANDNTKCLAPKTSTTSGQVCPDGSFSSGSSCTPCAAECQTCSGSTSNDCTICANGKYMNANGTCVSTDSNGVCTGSTLIADNIKHECDSCPSKCTACGIPNFSVASTVNQLTCTACLPSFVLSNGTCTESCPAGTFLSPTDNMTCQKCDSSCGSCLGSSTFCLTCAGGQLASQGKCVSSCPSNAFSSSGTCLTCHPDCATCSGTSFNQCSTCPADRPVLSNGRCLPTCAKAQFFDPTLNTCQTCDSSCSSCSASGPSGCLACSSTSQVLQAGTCVDAKCTSNTTVVAGLGVCLSDIVRVPTASSTSGAAPLPSLTGISAPTVVINAGPRQLAWWEILLMALGCAFIFLVIVMCWRRRARKQRAVHTARFAQTKALARPSWRDRLFFWRRRAPARGPVHLPSGGLGPAPDLTGTESEAIRLMRIRNAEEARHHMEMEKMQLYGAYEYSRASTHAPTTQERPRSVADSSLFSEMTGEPLRAPQPRQPVRTGDLLGLASRFSLSTYHSGERRAPSQAQAYAAQVRQGRLEPQPTGSSLGSRNPFRQ